MSKIIFTSIHRKLSISGNGKRYQFSPQGLVGLYATDKQDEIEFFRNHPSYKKDFDEFNGGNVNQANNIVSGARNAGTAVQAGESEMNDLVRKTAQTLLDKFKRYDGLKPKVMKLDGTLRKDAIEVEVKEFESLAVELGFNKQLEVA